MKRTKKLGKSNGYIIDSCCGFSISNCFMLS